MADEKPVTKSELLAVLKEAGVATRGDIQELATKDDLKRAATHLKLHERGQTG